MCRTHVPFEDYPMSQDGAWGNTIRFMTMPPDRGNLHKGVTVRVKRLEQTCVGGESFFIPRHGWETREWLDGKENLKHLHVKLPVNMADVDAGYLSHRVSLMQSPEDIQGYIDGLPFAEICRRDGISLKKPGSEGLITLFRAEPDGTGHLMDADELHGDMVWQGRDEFPFRYNLTNPPYFFEQVVTLLPMKSTDPNDTTERQLKVIAGLYMSSLYAGVLFDRFRRQVIKEEVSEAKMREIANPYMYLSAGELRPRHIGGSKGSKGEDGEMGVA